MLNKLKTDKNIMFCKSFFAVVVVNAALCACNGSGGGASTSGTSNNSTSAVSAASTENKKLTATSAETQSDWLTEYNFVYTADRSANVIHVFKVGYDGVLKHLSDVPVDGNGVSSITISPDKKHLYAVLDTDKKIKHFIINHDYDGSLTLQTDGLDNLEFKPGKLIFARDSVAYISSSPDETNPHLMVVGYDAWSGKFDQSVSYIEDQKSASDMVLSADNRHFWEGFTNVDLTSSYSIKGFYAADSEVGILTTPNVSASSGLIGDISALATQSIGSNEDLLVVDKTNQRLRSYRLNVSEPTTGVIASETNAVVVGSGPSAVAVAPNVMAWDILFNLSHANQGETFFIKTLLISC